VRALSITSSATLASMAATDAIERKASWIIEGHYIPSMTSIPGPFFLPLFTEVRGIGILGSSRCQVPPLGPGPMLSGFLRTEQGIRRIVHKKTDNYFRQVLRSLVCLA
jgi:hypothetical protein